ncbi:unnamed protein product [Nezara viridula]|uniref:BMP-binding endothelial regulator protein n=1 Tax=Nezara viridula TaxID=85310 RepID=A0A9P0MNW9_NEZVI|nr:unnamed protein product [Nezara viridula]
MLLGPPSGECCKKCKGCTHEGIERQSGEEWRDPDEPCRLYVCQAGVVTETVEQCYAPCHSPLKPAEGTCCPTCPGKIGCKVNGQEVSSGRTVRSLDDPCLKCSCSEGRFYCSKRACPVLNCANKAVMPPRPGECCPYCNGTRELYPPPQGRCLLGADLRLSGEDFHQDPCTLCKCDNGTSICKRPSCAPLDCPPEMQELQKGHCCPRCPQRPPFPVAPTVCHDGGKVYKDGESWEVDQCKSCSCKSGQVKCVAELCNESNKPCPPNHKLVTVPGQCCSKCVESDGVCTVFGDPHYRTFDGKFFSFQGSCKYQLAADCANHTFSIRVTNDARGTRTSSWTKTVSMKMKDMKVNLGEKRRVKINGERVKVPYESTSVTVTNTDGWVLVETKLGIKLSWDGDSFLELSVPPKYKGLLCGLCGNFNSISRDDMQTRRGLYATDADTLGASWRVGGKRACSRAHEAPPTCAKTRRSKEKERLCKLLRSNIFGECRNHLNSLPYYKSCIKDMCECPAKQRCYCESFTAYARECHRLGVKLDWRKHTGCLNHH